MVTLAVNSFWLSTDQVKFQNFVSLANQSTEYEVLISKGSM